MTFEKRRVLVDPSQVVLLNAGTEERIEPVGRRAQGCVTTIQLSPRHVMALSDRVGLSVSGEQPFARRLLAGSSRLAVAFHLLLALTREREPLGKGAGGPSFAVRYAVLAFADALERSHRRTGRPPSPCLEISELARRIREALVAHATERLSVVDIARMVRRSPSYVARVFKAEVGITINQYLQRVRISEALHRLGDGEQDLLDLALDLGYSSQSHFTSVFRRLVGVPPSRVWGRIQNREGGSAMELLTALAGDLPDGPRSGLATGS